MKIKRYKRNFLVDKRIQFQIITAFVTVALGFTLLISLFAYKWVLNLRPLFDQALMGPLKPTEAFQVIADQLLYRLIAIMAVMSVTFITVGIYMTHRFAGPLWKLQRDLNRFFDGEDIGVIRFRRRDDYQNLSVLINRLISGYNGPRKNKPQ